MRIPKGRVGDGGRMAKKLDLTEEQAMQFREIMQAKHGEMYSFHEEQYEKVSCNVENGNANIKSKWFRIAQCFQMRRLSSLSIRLHSFS